MLAVNFKRVALLLAIVMLMTSAAFAASPLIGGGEEPARTPAAPAQARGGSALVGGVAGSEYMVTLPGGIVVTYEGLWKHNDILEANFTVVSPRGGRIAFDIVNSRVIDVNDVIISTPGFNRGSSTWLNYGDNFQAGDLALSNFQANQQRVEAGVFIDDEKQDMATLTPNRPYRVMLRYWVPAHYTLTPTYNLISIVVNGFPAEFENVPVFLP